MDDPLLSWEFISIHGVFVYHIIAWNCRFWYLNICFVNYYSIYDDLIRIYSMIYMINLWFFVIYLFFANLHHFSLTKKKMERGNDVLNSATTITKYYARWRDNIYILNAIMAYIGKKKEMMREKCDQQQFFSYTHTLPEFIFLLILI